MSALDTLHCFKCYKFPSSNLSFYITNCMHPFCDNCRKAYFEDAIKTCSFCKKSPIKIIKIDSNLPENVKEYFRPLDADFSNLKVKLTRILQFQRMQRDDMMKVLRKKSEKFDELREAYNDSKVKLEKYKQALHSAHLKLNEKSQEIESYRSLSYTSSSNQTPPKSFNSNSYKTPSAPKQLFPSRRLTKTSIDRSSTCNKQSVTRSLARRESKTPRMPELSQPKLSANTNSTSLT